MTDLLYAYIRYSKYHIYTIYINSLYTQVGKLILCMVVYNNNHQLSQLSKCMYTYVSLIIILYFYMKD